MMKESNPLKTTKSNHKRAFWYSLGIATLCALFLFSLFFALCNDRFAFWKAHEEITVTVSATDTPSSVAKQLHGKGAIAFPRLYALSLGRYLKANQKELLTGEYTLSTDTPYRQLTERFVGKGREGQTVRLTFCEGETVSQMVERLVENGIGQRERYWEVIANYPFDFPFLPQEKQERAVRLEGYLYPDTYEFYQGSSEEAVIAKFLANFQRKFDAEYLRRTKELGYTVDQIVTLASMIQAEGSDVSEYGAISSVFSNRLRHWSIPRLESDATVKYALQLAGEERAPTPQDLRQPHPYNTYQNQGLPPGAICNPSKEAIAYAICPKSTNYYYFVAGKDGTAQFSHTYAEHQKKVAALS